MKHVVLVNSRLRGLEYGMLRDFEDEIVRLTGAEVVAAPHRALPRFVGNRLAHGTRYSGLRRIVPREEFDLRADVLWVVLMGPENFTLDMYKGWDRHVGVKILYLFDTLETHLTSIRRVLAATKWDFTSTAFHGAKPFLEEKTQRQWQVIRHAVNLDRFHPAPIEQRNIAFSAYGRRLDKVHEAIKQYCAHNGKYYDYTTAAAVQAQLHPREHYAQYAWHLAHSIFNFCWPVEITNPELVKGYSPITCRWFEAAASANVILGKAPTDPAFPKLFGTDAVIELHYNNGDLMGLWDDLWNNRDQFLQAALKRRAALSREWSWESRIREISTILGLDVGRAAAASGS